MQRDLYNSSSVRFHTISLWPTEELKDAHKDGLAIWYIRSGQCNIFYRSGLRFAKSDESIVINEEVRRIRNVGRTRLLVHVMWVQD